METIQSFELILGELYQIIPPEERKEGKVYLSGISKLLSIYANGTARFENREGITFTIPLTDNRIFGF